MLTGTPRFALSGVVLAGLLTTGPAGADIYRYEDQNGNVVFSDKPPTEHGQNVEAVELGKTNRAEPPPNIPRASANTEKPIARTAYTTTITSPADGTTVPMGPGNFAVTAMLSPPLNSDERAVLLLDGKPVGEPQRGSAWQLQSVFRGEHQLIVERRDKEGNTVNTSTAITVYVLRPSIR